MTGDSSTRRAADAFLATMRQQAEDSAEAGRAQKNDEERAAVQHVYINRASRCTIVIGGGSPPPRRRQR